MPFGQHTLRVRALDLADNASSVASFSFRVVGNWDAARDLGGRHGRRIRVATVTGTRPGSTCTAARPHDPANYHGFPTFAVMAPNWEIWHSSPGNPTQTAGSSTGVSNNRMIMHPGHYNLGQNAVLGWRSPVETDVLVMARIANDDRVCDVPENGVLWSIDKGGGNSIRSGFLAPSASTQLELTTSVSVGESLYVVVNDAGDWQTARSPWSTSPSRRGRSIERIGLARRLSRPSPSRPRRPVEPTSRVAAAM